MIPDDKMKTEAKVDFRMKKEQIKPIRAQVIMRMSSSFLAQYGLFNKIPTLNNEIIRNEIVSPLSRLLVTKRSKQRNVFEQNKKLIMRYIFL